MNTGYGWEGIRQVCATLLGARHVPECLCGGACLQRGAITSVRPLPFYPYQLRQKMAYKLSNVLNTYLLSLHANFCLNGYGGIKHLMTFGRGGKIQSALGAVLWLNKFYLIKVHFITNKRIFRPFRSANYEITSLKSISFANSLSIDRIAYKLWTINCSHRSQQILSNHLLALT